MSLHFTCPKNDDNIRHVLGRIMEPKDPIAIATDGEANSGQITDG